MAEEIMSDLSRYHQMLSWSGIPRHKQFSDTCDLMWRHLIKRGTQEIKTGRQLAYFTSQYWRVQSNSSAFIKVILTSDTEADTVDKAVHKAMKIARDWFEFRLPKSLSALDSIQKHIFNRYNLHPGDYGYYAANIEYVFCPPTLSELQEVGLPLSVIKKLQPYLQDPNIEDIDNLLQQIRHLHIEKLPLDKFEQQLLREILGPL
ncbi:MAG: hypothetical protein ACYCYO_13675 [Bacilli bacterium]